MPITALERTTRREIERLLMAGHRRMKSVQQSVVGQRGGHWRPFKVLRGADIHAQATCYRTRVHSAVRPFLG